MYSIAHTRAHTRTVTQRSGTLADKGACECRAAVATHAAVAFLNPSEEAARGKTAHKRDRESLELDTMTKTKKSKQRDQAALGATSPEKEAKKAKKDKKSKKEKKEKKSKKDGGKQE